MRCDGDLGDEILDTVCSSPDGNSFMLTSEGNCPFLREDGLCRMIIEKGEDFVCDICRLHPRFFFDYEDDEFMGLGLSCERTCELLMEGSLGFRNESDEKLTLSEILREKVSEFEPVFSQEETGRILDMLENTEPIDEFWSIDLMGICSVSDEDSRSIYEAQKGVIENIYEYIIYRQIELLYIYDLQDIVEYAKLSTEFIILLVASGRNLTEAVVRWSEQIEYDTENVEICLLNI